MVRTKKIIWFAVAGALVLGTVLILRAKPPVDPTENSTLTTHSNNMQSFQKPSPDELKKKLNAMQFNVTQHAATEPAFKNEFWDNHEPGLYVDIVSGKPLFSSLDKFDSGCGWPSFMLPAKSEAINEHEDVSFGMRRVEVTCANCGGHLGHVFPDGPKPTGLRYCINSASLTFTKRDE